MEDEDFEGKLEEVDEEDLHSKNPEFKLWLNWTVAQVCHLRTLLKLADKVDSNDDEGADEDGAFEDIDIDSEGDEPVEVIDIDELKLACLRLINIPFVLEMT